MSALNQPHRLQLVLQCVRRSLAILLLHFLVSLTWNFTTVKKYVFRGQGQFTLEVSRFLRHFLRFHLCRETIALCQFRPQCKANYFTQRKEHLE